MMGPVLSSGELQLARAEKEHVNVSSSFRVVEKIPTSVVRIVVHHEILRTIPTPIQGYGPVPGGYLKVESTGEPELVTVSVEAADAELKCWANMREPAVLERAVHVKTPVVRTVMPEP